MDTVKRFLRRLSLFYAVSFAYLLGVGVLLYLQPEPSAIGPSRIGEPAQVLWWALSWMIYLVSWAAPPVLAVAFAVHAMITRSMLHPRLVALGIGLATIVAVVTLVPRSNPPLVVALAAPAIVIYVLLLRWDDGHRDGAGH